jgi:tetratricopeptide (TPR) repeat protein
MKITWIDRYLNEAEGLIMNDQIEDGLRILNNLLFEEPGYAPLHSYLGWAYLYYEVDESRAELHFTMAIRFDASYAPPFLHMANLQVREKRYSDAISYAEQGLTKPEANKVALYEVMGNAYEMTRQLGKAIRAYRRATMSSTASYEVNNFSEGIKRCWRKRVTGLFMF